MFSKAMDEKFIDVPRKAIIYSLILHLLLLLSYSLPPLLNKLGFNFFVKKRFTENKFQNFIQVDLISLPQELLKEQNAVDTLLPVAKNPTTTSTITSKEKMAIEEKKSDTLLMVDKKENQSAKKRESEREKALTDIEQEMKREQALKNLSNLQNKRAERSAILGNILSKGTSTQGAIGTDLDRYASLVASKIKECFNVYPWQKKKELLTVVFLKVTEDGKVISKNIEESSRNQLYDSSVMKAIEDCEPLPRPTDYSLVEDGIYIRFTPEE